MKIGKFLAFFMALSLSQISFARPNKKFERHPLEEKAIQFLKQKGHWDRNESETANNLKKIVEKNYIEGLLRYTQITDKILPNIYNTVLNLSLKLNIGKPVKIFVKESEEFGAYTIAASTNDYIVVILSKTIQQFHDKHIRILLAHELSHIKLEHSKLVYIIKTLNKDEQLELIKHLGINNLNEIARAAELSTDRAAYFFDESINESDFYETILMFASGGIKNLSQQETEGYLDQITKLENLNTSAKTYEEIYQNMPERKRDNPFPSLKVIELKNYIKSLNLRD